MTLIINSCQKCVLFTMDRSCLAFDKIPNKIWFGENDHTEKYNGDHGLRFTPLKNEDKK